jgi:CheY-like chemotaxis protein
MSIQLKDIPTDVPIEGITDASWLQDNLLCMVGNACKYSERTRVRSSGGIIVVVRRVMVGGRPLIEFAVKDCGVTLAPVALQAFFMRPVTFRRESVGGMGLGMCCLAARVSALGGSYGARPRPDDVPGTVVWFRIPFDSCKNGQKATRSSLCLEKPVSASASVDPGPGGGVGGGPRVDAGLGPGAGTGVVAGPGASAGVLTVSNSPHPCATRSQPQPLVVLVKSAADKPLRGLTILVVDDAPTIVKMVVRQLINAGATVESAKDGREGVEVFKAADTYRFDIVITDIQVRVCSFLNSYSLSMQVCIIVYHRRCIDRSVSSHALLCLPRCPIWMAGACARTSDSLTAPSAAGRWWWVCLPRGART